MPFPVMSAEQRASNLEQARAVRKVNAEARRNSDLRQDFDDASYWEDLARNRGLRLPPWGMACTVSRMTRWLHKIGMSVTSYQEDQCRLSEFIALNPDVPMRAWAGETLEPRSLAT